MSIKEQRKTPPSPEAGERKRGRRILLAFVLWSAMLIALGISWGIMQRPQYLSRLTTWLKWIDERSGEIPPPASVGSVRLPMCDKGNLPYPFLSSFAAHETTEAIRNPDSSTERFKISAANGARLQVGLAHASRSDIYRHWEYKFSVREMQSGKEKKLLEKTLRFDKGNWGLFDIALPQHDDGNGTLEIEYALQPIGIKARIGTFISALKGAPPYYKDFVFVTPTVLPDRNPDEYNVLVISFDTLRPDRLGCFGYARETSPNIDAFANENVLLPNAFSSSPWTLPAHHSLFSGLYPSAHLRNLGDVRKYASYAEKVLAEILHEAGYYTIGITGGLHLTSANGFARGFDRYMEFDYRAEGSDKKIFSHAVEWLGENHDTKFFMFLHTYACHSPYTETYFVEKENVKGVLEQRKALYDGDIRYADALFGSLIDKLAGLNLLSKTLVVVVSDHGEDFHDHVTGDDVIPPQIQSSPHEAPKIDHGHSVYDEVIRILTIFHVPDVQVEKRIIQNPIRIIDVMPTILAYLGIRSATETQGTSLFELLKTGERPHDPPVISEFTLRGPERKSVRTKGFKYIYIPDMEERKDGVTFKNIRKHELFNLENDPAERDNLYDQTTTVAEDYQTILEETLEESAAIYNRLEESSQSAVTESIEYPRDVLESLKAIGYID
jgi:arylsulfatase A-like enzyme